MEYKFPKSYYVISVLVGILVSILLIGCAETNRFTKENELLKSKLVNYEHYYRSTEALLDSLEDAFNWIDRYDGQALDNYSDAKDKLKN